MSGDKIIRGLEDALEGRMHISELYHRDLMTNSWKCPKHGLFDPENIRGAVMCPGCVSDLAMQAELQKYLTDFSPEMSWHISFLRLAAFWTNERSKDPSTKVGAVLVSPDRSEVVLGYNGFPPGVEDKPERYADRTEKYARVVHAEANAILNAHRNLEGWTLYVHPLLPCSGRDGGHNCAGMVIRSKIKRVVVPASALTHERWRGSCATSLEMFQEAKIDVIAIEDKELD